jgi:uncharacterized protein involved in exopolysaccharide biosynthesis/Mrp family chromosome partitioning ATPase
MRVVSGRSSNGRDLTPSTAADDLDFRALGRALWYRKAQIIFPAVLMALAAFVAVNALTPKYRSEARVLIEGRENVYLRPEAEKTSDRGVVDPEAVTSQVQVILSRDLGRRVVRQLKLGELSEFDPVLKGVSIPGVLLRLFDFVRDPLRMSPEERVLDAYYARLSVYAIERSRVIAVSFDSSNPDLAARVANAVVDAYLELQQAAKQEQARAASRWLAGEIANMRTKVADAEAKVEEFRSKSNLFAGPNNASLATQQLGDVNTQVAAARGQKADAETKARLIRDMLRAGVPLESSEVLNSDLIRRLGEQRVTLSAQLAEQSATLLEFHPRIKELRAQIGDLENQIRSEAERIVRSLESNARIAEARVETLNVSFNLLKRQAASSNEQDVDLRALEREAKAERDLLESYLAKYREAIARDSINAAPAEARVISRATVSNTPAFPKKLPIVLLVALATLVLVVGFVLTSELLGGGTYVAARPAAPSLLDRLWGAKRILARRRQPEREIAMRVSPGTAMPASSMDDLVQSLRGGGETGRRITFLGTTRNVGTTHAAITLSRALANEARVVLVDLALRSPNISIISSDPNAPGIVDLVHETASFGEIITRDRFSRLHLVSVGQAGPEGDAILVSQRLEATLDALGRAYDHVVVDAGAVSETAVELFVRLAPRAVLVAVDLADPATAAVRDRLLAAGFTDVTVLPGRPLEAVAA